MSFEEFAVRILVSLISIAYVFWVWRGQGGTTKSVSHGNQTIQGEVRGFRERKERKNQQAAVDDTVWTFRLERYLDGHRLPPIPVEMRGQISRGFINEGDTVKLLDKWGGEGLHRTKQVYNITNSTMVEAKKIGHSIWLKLWIALFLSAIGAFILFLQFGQ